MKYQNLAQFESFLSSVSLDKRPRVFLIVMDTKQEREALFQKIISCVAAIEHTVERLLPSMETHQILDTLLTPSLFGGETVAILDECDLLKKKDAENLSARLNPSGLLLLGAKGKTPLLKEVEKAGVVLDFSSEKPWEKQKRYQESLILKAKQEGKFLSSDAAMLLLERSAQEMGMLFQELTKLICFVGDRPNIERSDVFRISTANFSGTPWKTAEEIIWEGDAPGFDPAGFFGLVFSLRAQLEMGTKIISLNEQGVSPSQWAAYFPKVWPKTLDKRRDQAMRKGSVYFKKGLETLFKIEMLSRTGVASAQSLFDLFRTTLKSYDKR